MKHFIVLFLVFVSLISCSNEPHFILNTVKSDSSFSKHGYDIIEVLPATTRKLLLPPISKGVDSFECRFWLRGGKISDTINILSIKYSSNKWESTLTKFFAILPDHEFRRGDTTNYFRQETIKYVNTLSIHPDINTNAIIDTLANFDLQNSPLNAEIEAGQAYSSGDIRYILEFADKTNYRVLHYFRASRNSGLAAFDKNFEQFLNFIKRHYKINTH